MKVRRLVCLLVTLIMAIAMTTITADAASFKSAPKGVKAKCVSGVAVSVSCKAKKGATGYSFYYATKKKGKYKLGATSKTRTGTVKGLTPGKTYYFKVRAFKGQGAKSYSKMSKPKKCKTVLKAPSVKVKDSCCCKAYFQFSGSAGAKGYRIYRSTNKSSGFTRVKTTSSKTWTDTGLAQSKTYYYKVRGYYGSYNSPYSGVITVKTTVSLGNGNDAKYDPGKDYSALKPVPTSPIDRDNNRLTGSNILFLGSSVTEGIMGSTITVNGKVEGVSFPEYIEARNGVHMEKEAKSGTTMAISPVVSDSYVVRLKQWRNKNKDFTPDIFACQLSLNDSLAKNKVQLGSLPSKTNLDSLSDEQADELLSKADTVGRAIGYITAYAYHYWPDCQVVFYTVRDNGYNDQYKKMCKLLSDAKREYGNIEIIDMWNEPALTNLKGNQFCLFMSDANHPKKAGYLYQWTPIFEHKLNDFMPYKVTWKNGDEDGSILEIDRRARFGSKLSYDGELPQKPGYHFIGWKNAETDEFFEPADISNMTVTGDVTYIAVFEEGNEVEQNIPIEDGQDSQNNELDEQSAPNPEVINEEVDKTDNTNGDDQTKNEYEEDNNLTSIISQFLRAA